MENLENNSFDLDSENEGFEVNENKKSFSFLNNSPIIKNLILASITLVYQQLTQQFQFFSKLV